MKCFANKPVPAFMVFFQVLKEPKLLFTWAYFSLLTSLVERWTDAPKAPAPLEEVPTPLCTCTDCNEEATSGISTKKVPWLSASLYGMPLSVTFMREASEPRMRIPV